MASSSAKKGKGRQKAKMENIEKESNLQVTFSKRRNGLFQKAFELSVLTEAEVAAVVFSPGRKAYSYGHPSVDIVADKFLTGKSQSTTQNADVEDAFEKLAAIKAQLAAEKKRGAELDKILEQSRKQIWDDGDNLSQLLQSYNALKNLKECVKSELRSRANEDNGNGGDDGDGSDGDSEV